jgi:hypothetical protein
MAGRPSQLTPQVCHLANGAGRSASCRGPHLLGELVHAGQLGECVGKHFPGVAQLSQAFRVHPACADLPRHRHGPRIGHPCRCGLRSGRACAATISMTRDRGSDNRADPGGDPSAMPGLDGPRTGESWSEPNGLHVGRDSMSAASMADALPVRSVSQRIEENARGPVFGCTRGGGAAATTPPGRSASRARHAAPTCRRCRVARPGFLLPLPARVSQRSLHAVEATAWAMLGAVKCPRRMVRIRVAPMTASRPPRVGASPRSPAGAGRWARRAIPGRCFTKTARSVGIAIT